MKSISDVERDLQVALDALRHLPLSPELKASLKFLLPDGLRPVVQLEEEGRKKRSSASISNWDPTTGEIRIYFDPIIAVAGPTPAMEDVPAPGLPAPNEERSSNHAGSAMDGAGQTPPSPKKIANRFQPIPIRGEMASATLLRDRG